MYSFFGTCSDVIAAMSTKNDGNMKIRDLNKDQEVIQNRIRFCDKLCIPYENSINALVTHSTNVAVVDSASSKYLSDVDALVTKEKNIFLSVTTADCFPVLFYDDAKNITAVAHAGWRGVVNEIIPETVNVMKKVGSDPRNIRLEIGPGISQNQFDFGLKEMMDEFGFYSQDKYVVPGSTIGKVRVNLQQIIIDQAGQVGISFKRIKGCTTCTFSDEKYYSARRHGGDSFEAMLTVTGMKE